MICAFFQAEPKCTTPDDLVEQLFLSFSGYESVTLSSSPFATTNDTFINWIEASPYVPNSKRSLSQSLFFDGKRFLQERELDGKSFS